MEDEYVPWIPLPKQEIALRSTANEILYGGGRGSGKSEVALVFLLEYVEIPTFRGLIIRKNSVDLADFMNRARVFYQGFSAKIKGNPPEIHFPSGAIIHTTHLATVDAFEKIKGWEVHKMVLEEATTIPSEKQYEQVLGSLRSKDPRMKTQILLTSNPDGEGAEWLKERFEILTREQSVKFLRDGRSYIYIHSVLSDNPHLADNDPDYMVYLQSLKGALRDQWLYGSWDDFTQDGAYYGEEIVRAGNENRIGSVPFRTDLPTWSFWDLGHSDAMSVWTIQAEMSGRYNVVDFISKRKSNLPNFAAYLKKLEEIKGFNFTGHFLPHDGEVTEIGTGDTRVKTLQKQGLTGVQSIPRTKNLNRDIAITRGLIAQCWFDKVGTKEGVKALKVYKENFSHLNQSYTGKPKHDWASDPSDAFRTFAVAWNTKKLSARSVWNNFKGDTDRGTR